MVKKAQMKIQQTAFMLLALTLLFVLVGLFFLSFKLNSVRSEAENLEARNAIILASKLSETPEFSCEEAFGSKRVNCIDSDKLIVIMKDPEKYEDFLGISNIGVRKVLGETEITCTQENYPDCNYFNVFSKENAGFSKESFVSLCRKSLNQEGSFYYDKCELARLMINYEQK